MNTNRPPAWSENEDRALVRDYLTNRDAALRGEKVNKAETLRALLPQLNGRSRGSVEFKRCNVSAVLAAIGEPIWPGYLGRDNCQTKLVDTVRAVIAERSTT